MSRAVWALAVALALLVVAPLGAVAQVAAQNRLLKSDAIVPLRSHSLYAPYVDSNLQNKFWDFGGDAYVDTNKYIRLTQDRGSQAGWLWTRAEIQPENYEIQVEFSIDGKAAGHKPYGDGFAMWLTTERATPGPVFGSKDYFTGLGIMFDTFANSRHPYTFPRVLAINGNGVERYNVGKDGAPQEVAGCSVSIRRAAVATKARLTYVKDVFLELALHYNEWDDWETCFKLDNITIPERPYLGFSAATGDVSDNHDIVSVSTSNIIYKERSAAEKKAHRLEHFPPGGAAKAGEKKAGGWFSKKKKADSGPPSSGSNRDTPSGPGFLAGFFSGVFSLVWFVLKWASVLGLIGAAAYAYFRWQKKKDAKRF